MDCSPCPFGAALYGRGLSRVAGDEAVLEPERFRVRLRLRRRPAPNLDALSRFDLHQRKRRIPSPAGGGRAVLAEIIESQPKGEAALLFRSFSPQLQASPSLLACRSRLAAANAPGRVVRFADLCNGILGVDSDREVAVLCRVLIAGRWNGDGKSRGSRRARNRRRRQLHCDRRCHAPELHDRRCGRCSPYSIVPDSDNQLARVGAIFRDVAETGRRGKIRIADRHHVGNGKCTRGECQWRQRTRRPQNKL